MTNEQNLLVLHMLQVGKYSEAVITYQEEAGVDFESAKIAIEKLATQHGIASLRPSLWTVVTVGLATTLVLWLVVAA